MEHQGIAAQPPALPPQGLKAEDERLYATLIHLSGLLWVVGIPGVIGTVIVWLLKREQSAFVDEHGKQGMNFQISMFIYFAAIGILSVFAALLTVVLVGFLLFIPILLAGLVFYVLQIVLSILASIQANRGNLYRYPMTIPFIR